jgi:uncharacterized membrane protein
MEEIVKEIAARIALAVELLATLLIAYGTVEAIIRLLTPRPRGLHAHHIQKRREIFQRFGGWLLLALEFELAADIVRSAISPTWTQIGQLGAIAAIRTFLNYFLEKDVEKVTDSVEAADEA